MPRSAILPNDSQTRAVWSLLEAHQGEPFMTAKGLPYTYTIRGGELFVDRRAKSITIATVAAALRRIEAYRAKGEAVTGPKMIGCYGASYLYPVFASLGVLPTPEPPLTLEAFARGEGSPSAGASPAEAAECPCASENRTSSHTQAHT